MAAVLTASGYKATRTADGKLIVHDVPFFCACTRTDKDGHEVPFDDKWISSAVAFAKRDERERNYLPPLHIYHHGDEKPRRAGRFRIRRTGVITYEGTRRTAVFADLIVVDDWAQEDVLKQQVPYRSVELKIAEPQFQSLALLDTEAPYLRLPMLMVGEIEEGPASQFAIDDLDKQTLTAGAADARLVFTGEALAMADKEQAEMFGDDGDGPPDKKDGDDTEQMMEGELDVKAVVKAIKSKSISIGDMDEILAAIQEAQAGGEQEEPEAPAPAAVPGGAAMKADKETAVQLAALRGELDGIKAERAQDKATQKRKDDVAHALERLRDRPCGADIEEKLTKFHEECGGKEEVFNAYVDALTNTVAPRKQGGAPVATFNAELPDFVMKYAEQGGDAPDRAAQAWHRWRDAKASGATSLSEERYVELAMRRSERVFNAGRN